MAELTHDGLDGLIKSLQELADIPPEVQDDILNAQADIAVAAQKRKIRAYGIYDLNSRSTAHVANSIKKGKVKLTKDGYRAIYVTAAGSRRRGKTTTRNAEILFVNEYGKKTQRARPAVRDANEECADEVAAVALQIYDKFLESKNL